MNGLELNGRCEVSHTSVCTGPELPRGEDQETSWTVC